MRETGRNEYLMKIVRRYSSAKRDAERRRPDPNIEGYVEDLSLDHPYQLSLWSSKLGVKTPPWTLRRDQPDHVALRPAAPPSSAWPA